jgi:uncharacterized protein YbjT (DUF2867 family)
MSTSNIIAVTGATGQQGGAVARHLLKAGWQVRALTRDITKPAARQLGELGAQVVEANNHSRESLDAAFAGVYGVFSVQGFWEAGVDDETRQGIAVADAALAAGVRHFVYTSVGGADRNSGVPHFESKWQIEQHIREIGLPATILRPVEFMENFFWSRDAVINGTLMSQGLRPTRKKQLIAVDDIGAFAAIVFADSQRYIGQAFELAGDALTEQEIAETFSKITGQPVHLVDFQLPPEQPGREELLQMWAWFDREGYNADISALRAVYPPLQTLEMWLHRTGWNALQPAISAGA